ncbi:MAG: hypothetical protein KDE48_21550 [Anaerolineales bacterium]|nr:hypothetical protein [Anaerolineales bacterium]
MRKIFLSLLFLLIFMLAACSSQPEPTTPIQEIQDETVAQETPVEKVVPTEALPVEKPSEPVEESVQQVSARPQLVEFYADW